MLFILLTGSVFVAAIYRSDDKNELMIGLHMIVELVLFTFGLYAIMFCIAYFLGRLNKFFIDQAEVGQSPFATDRLPQQILPPVNQTDA